MLVLGRAAIAEIDLWADDRRNVLACRLRLVEELQDLLHRRVLQHQQVLRQVLHQGQEAALGVVPRVRVELLVVRLQRLDDARDAELEVALRTVQGADDYTQQQQEAQQIGQGSTIDASTERRRRTYLG